MTDILAAAVPRVLAAIAPHVDAKVWTAALIDPMRSSGITTASRIAMFLGQVAVETEFEELRECLYYSRSSRILQEWPDEFAHLSPIAYIGRPEALGNFVYAYRLGNGDVGSGDGYRFRGAGLTQITGRTDHARFAASVGRELDEAAAWCETPEGAAAAGCWDWTANYGGKLNALSDAWDIRSVTRAVNGSWINLSERVLNCNHARAAIAGLAPPSAPNRVAPRTPAAPQQSEADRLDNLYNPPAALPASTGT
jgi:putative chitinase